MSDLLDNNGISELPKPRPDQNVHAHLTNRSLEQLFISAVTIAEVRYGILITSEPQRKYQLEKWLEEDVRKVFRGRTLPVTESILVRWRALMQQGRQSGRTYAQPDLLIAATALEHDLPLVTRNTKDFAGISNLKLTNPWEPNP